MDNIAPLKESRIKTNTSEWFDGEVANQIKIRNNLFRKFKVSKLLVDEELYKNYRRFTQNLIKNKKKNFMKEN